jgi:hypothetical protein
MGGFRSHLKQGGPSDVNPETEVTSNFYGYHIYVSFWWARYWLSNRWESQRRFFSFHLSYRPKVGSESSCGRGSTGCADVVFRASSPALVQSRVGLLDSQVVSAAVLSSFFA